MAGLEFQKLHRELEDPIEVGGFGAAPPRPNFATEMADKFIRDLNSARIYFSAVDQDPLIVVSVARADYPLIKVRGVKLPGAFPHKPSSRSRKP